MAKRKKLSKAEAGRIGGRTTARRHGIEHFRAAGRKGFMATVARHWQGDKSGYLRWLHAKGFIADVQRLIDARPADGQVRVYEIPYLPELDDEEVPL